MKSEHFRMQLFAGGRDDFEPKGRPPANAAGSPEALPEKLTWIFGMRGRQRRRPYSTFSPKTVPVAGFTRWTWRHTGQVTGS